MDDKFSYGKSLQSQELWEQAQAVYEEIIAENPNFFQAITNLGVVLEQQGQYKAAIESYQRALEITSEYAIIYYNCAHAYHQSGRLNEAVKMYTCALELEPDSLESQFNLGLALHEQQRYESAESALAATIEMDPEFIDGHRRLGDLYFDTRHFPQALVCYLNALDKDVNRAETHFDIGRTLDALGKQEDAVESYRASLDRNPRSRAARENLTDLLRRMDRDQEAIEVYRDAVAIDPNDAIAKHMLAALGDGSPPARASDAYVERLFDDFAKDFDVTLSRLNYQAPQLIAQTVSTLGIGERGANTLDIGCGTGLCGKLLRQFADRLVGLDLSSAMLQQAKKLEIYDDLVHAELTRFLQQSDLKFDLMVAADTLIYFGELDDVCRGAHGALRPGGHFVFTLESLSGEEPSDSYRLNHHGRYSHRRVYINRVLCGAGFASPTIQDVVLRSESGADVTGMLVHAIR